MRPRSLDEFVGQGHVLGRGKLLREAIERDNIPSFIMWGPPGCGKTTLAGIIKKKTGNQLRKLAAVTSGVKDVREIVQEARARLSSLNQKTILFVDEIHRFNKAQQDAFLPHVESGTIILIGATTENPYFEVITPLLSRSRVFRLNPISSEDMQSIIELALADEERGMGKLPSRMEEDALELLAESSGGDARIALNALETAVLVAEPGEDGVRRIGVQQVLDSLQSRYGAYDKTGEAHYDTISAFIKSIRGSDPDGALFYLARMIANGEDPKFIARRMIILASEDVGLADPFALNIANAAATAVQFVGMPEARITLAEAAVYLSCAPKSNTAYMGLCRAVEALEKHPGAQVPMHLRNPVTKGMKAFGYGKDYRYAHDYDGHFVRMQFLPDQLKDARFYQPGELGHEKKIRSRLQEWWGDRFD
jgi:putative ATPase